MEAVLAADDGKHTFRNSAYDRRSLDRYFTESWCTKCLLPFIPEYVRKGTIWEPACGRGDMSRVLIEDGLDVVSSDLDPSEFDGDLGSIAELNFLETTSKSGIVANAIITNPPYGDNAERFNRHALDFQEIDYVAMLLRHEYDAAKTRRDLFDRDQNFECTYAYKIVLVDRPVWDWWLPPVELDPWEEKKKNSPVYNYAWYVWDRQWNQPTTTFWRGKADVD